MKTCFVSHYRFSLGNASFAALEDLEFPTENRRTNGEESKRNERKRNERRMTGRIWSKCEVSSCPGISRS